MKLIPNKSESEIITLGIESSCDETACAVLRGGRELLSSVVASSLPLHEKFGGVVPEIASRHCLECMPFVYEEALRQAGIRPDGIDLIGVTYGPGLVGSLLIGLSFAKGLSYRLRVSLLGVNHLEAHLFVNMIEESIQKPFIGLIVSGGHTALVYADDDSFKLLGQTRDDALGEAFDKVAITLDLGYPGGPLIEKTALEGDENKILFKCADLPGTFDFSFSGIKTGVLYYAQASKQLSKEIPDICAAFQKSVFDVVVKKTLQAMEKHQVKTLVVGGGVSANRYFKNFLETMAGQKGYRVHFPPIRFAIDNGAMIAKRAYDLAVQGHVSKNDLAAEPALAIA